MLVPISIDFDTKMLSLIDVPYVDYREPFFEDTIRIYRQLHPGAKDLQISLEEYKLLAKQLRSPNGFIFNVGRCGSTLLANMFSSNNRFLILKEPTIFDNVLARVLHARHDNMNKVDMIDLLTWITTALFQTTRGTEEYFLIKCSSWNVNAANLLLKIFPDAQAIFLYRDIVDVVQSFVLHPVKFNDLPEGIKPNRYIFFPNAPLDVDTVSEEEFYAYLWRSNCLAALETEYSRVLFLGYNQLRDSPDSSLRTVAKHLRMSVSYEEIARMCEVTQWYSKDVSQTRRFIPSHSQLNVEKQAKIFQIADEIPGRLSDRAQRQTTSY